MVLEGAGFESNPVPDSPPEVKTRSVGRYFAVATLFRLSTCYVALAGCFILAVAVVAWTRPFLGWDMLPYVAIVHSWTDTTQGDAHEAAYADAARFAAVHHLETEMSTLQKGRYRQTMATDAAAFDEQLPFYRIRPLYLAIVAAVGSVTATISEATLEVAVFSFWACCMVVLCHAVRALGALAGSIVGALFALAPPVTQAAKLCTPDTLLMLLVTVAALLFVRNRLKLAAGLLTIGVLIRTDIEVFDLCLAAAWLLLARKQRGVLLVSGILASAVPVAMAVNAWAGNYGYVVLYRFTFIEGNVAHPGSLRGLGIPLDGFARNIEAGVRYSLENGGLWMLLAILGLCVALLARLPPAGPAAMRRDTLAACQALLLAVGVYTAARFMLFPELDLRLVAPPVAILTVVLLTIGAHMSRVARDQAMTGPVSSAS
jgi:hypothetical protein